MTNPDTHTPLDVLAFCGSLRAKSLNRALLHAARELAPAGMTIVEYEGLRDIPHYDGDLDGAEPPAVVEALKARIRQADALLFVSPEYNYSVPGVLKNAIDWASRPVAASVLRGKPAAIMGATGGMSGTMRMQHHLRQIFVGIAVYALPQPEVQIPQAGARFDADLRLTDESTRDLVRRQLEALADWTRRLAPHVPPPYRGSQAVGVAR